MAKWIISKYTLGQRKLFFVIDPEMNFPVFDMFVRLKTSRNRKIPNLESQSKAS